MKKEIKFIDLSRPSILDFKIISSFKKLMKENNYIMGHQIKMLENKLKYISGSKYFISCSNGTDALILSLMSLGISKNDVVFVPSYTFASTAESVSILGAIPFFIDISKKDFNICIKDLECGIILAKQLKYKAKCIIAVDLFGRTCNYRDLLLLSEKYNLKLIFDSAQNFGGTYNKLPIGCFGLISTTSFFPTKNLGCFGDGGGIFLNDKILYKKILSLRNHGFEKEKYKSISVGMNARMDTIQAITLIEKIFFFKKEIKMKRKIANLYNIYFNKYFNTSIDKIESIYAQYFLIFNNGSIRDYIKKKLYEKNIHTNIYYPIPLHMQEAYKFYPRTKEKLEFSELISKNILNLPIYPYMNKKIIYRIIFEIKKCIEKFN